jgi:hypothetical protein
MVLTAIGPSFLLPPSLACHVTSLYKPEYDKCDRNLQYGLIAEQAAKIYPELVANDKDGQPYSV